MLMLWILFALMTGLAVFSLLWPLSRQPRTTSVREGATSFYREQVAEIGRDVARGLLAPSDAQTAQAEAARRLLQAADRAEASRGASAIKARIVAGAALVGIPAVALGLYLAVGDPDLPDRPLAARLAADPARLDLAGAVAKIEAHLAAHPDDGRGYEVVAPAYLRLGRIEEAVRARREALRLLGPTAERQSLLGEALVFANDGVVSADARATFEAAAALDPRNPMPRFYLGLAAAEDGKPDTARTIWTALLADAPADAPYVPAVRARLAALAPEGGPAATDAGAAIAALPADAQRQAIGGMVDGLARRLATNGADPDGWLRLVRAYKVLGDGTKAMDALRDARRNLAGNSAALTRLAALARELELDD